MKVGLSAAVAALALVLALVACSGDGLVPGEPYEGAPFWDEVDLSGAPDLGHVPRALDPGERIPPGALDLEDVTVAAGLGGALGAGNPHGVGIAFVDLDGDELPDILVANGRIVRNGAIFPSHFYRNDGDGTFTDATASSGIGAIVDGLDLYSIAAADYDLDGDIDVYLGAQPRDLLLRNRGDGTFENATAAAGAGGPASDPSLVRDGRSKVVAFGDLDGDGNLDIVSASSTLPSPNAYLLMNNGDGTFRDATAETGAKASSIGNPCAVMWTDYDNDGDADLWIWNDRGDKVLLRNRDGARFDDVTRTSVGTVINNPMGIDGADIDHDLDLDYYISNTVDNPLLQNNGDGTFTDITRAAGTRGDYGWGLAFEDFNHDSWPDIFVAQEDNRPSLTLTNQQTVPATFEELAFAHAGVLDSNMAHNVAVAFADYDRDGRVDVVRAGTDGQRITLYRNVTDTGSHRWLEVVIPSTPGTGERGGIGARVGIEAGGLIQFRDVTGGSSRASQNELSVRFGLGDFTGVDYVYALWPDGRRLAVTGVEGNQTIRLGE